MIIDAINIVDLEPKLILLTEESFQSPLGDELLQVCRNEKIAPYVTLVSDNVLKACSNTMNPQGVVAAFNRPSNNILSETSSHILILDTLSDPGNIGTLIRTAYGLGFDSVICIGGADPYSPKAVRSSMGSCLLLPVLEKNWEDISELLSSSNLNNVPIFVAELNPINTIPYYQASLKDPCIIIIGSEAHGVSEQALSLPNSQSIYIPMKQNLESLNAAMAGAIIMAEAKKN